jgi:hypothetical protein
LAFGPWVEPVSGSAGALLALLAAKPRLGAEATAVATLVGPRIGSTVLRLEPYAGFVVVTACALAGMGVALALARALRRLRVVWGLPAVLFAAAEAVAHARAPWMVAAVPVAIVGSAALRGPRAPPAGRTSRGAHGSRLPRL